jgi:hypothetical protein
MDLKTFLKSLFSKLQNGGLIQDGTTKHYFILSGLVQLFLTRFYHINPFCKIKHFHIPEAQNNSNQNGVNIHDGDFTFIYPSL